jgi:glycosyltransferase involved in cell wall biosynthesis
MKVSLGILAWNEESSIGVSLGSVFAQSLAERLRARGDTLEVVVVPNGCTDATAARAEEALALNRRAHPHVQARVCSLAKAGKIHAWNEFVHRLSDPSAAFVFLADADIALHGEDTLWNMLRALEENPGAIASTDLPVKHLALKEKKGVLDRLSLGTSAMTQAAPGQLTGQLYCARGDWLRRAWMPDGLLLDDGFLKTMIVTEFFSRPADPSRVVRAPDAAHVFEAYTRLRDILPNQRRQAVGHAVWVILRERLAEAAREGPVDAFLARECGRDPEWFRKHLRQRVAQMGWWVMPPGMFGVRFRRLRNLPPRQRWARLPAALAGAAVDAVVTLWANRTLRRNQLASIWKDTKTTALPAPPPAP